MDLSIKSDLVFHHVINMYLDGLTDLLGVSLLNFFVESAWIHLARTFVCFVFVTSWPRLLK